MLDKLTRDKKESLYHATLILTKQLRIGTPSADNNTRELLEQHGSFEAIFRKEAGLFADEVLRKTPNVEEILKTLENEADFETFTINDPEYPLRNVPDSTPVLYLRGDKEYFKTKTIAVVGTRKPEQIDLDEGEKILERLLAQNYTIVSGLADGCDTLAHRHAVEKKGKTIAVLRTPLDKTRKKIKELQETIAQQH